MPARIQLRRTRGWKKPDGAVKVDRSTIFGNPFKVNEDMTAAAAVAAFRVWLAAERTDLAPGRRKLLLRRLQELRGKDLACWCRLCPEHASGKPLGLACPACDPCHSDVIGELANAPANDTFDVSSVVSTADISTAALDGVAHA